VSIKPLIERTRERGPTEPSLTEKRAKAGPAALALEALVIHTLTSSKPSRPRLEATDAMEHVLLEEERPELTVQLGRGITAADQQSLISLIREYKDVFAFDLKKCPTSLQI